MPPILEIWVPRIRSIFSRRILFASEISGYLCLAHDLISENFQDLMSAISFYSVTEHHFAEREMYVK